MGSLANYKGSPFVSGHSNSDFGRKTEILDHMEDQWNEADDYPIFSQYGLAMIVNTSCYVINDEF